MASNSNISQWQNEVLLTGFMIILKITKCMLFPIIHSISCEKFYMTVEEAETACIQLMKNRNCPKSQKHLCKAVLRLNHTFSKMSTCGLFCADAMLAIFLLEAVTNYSIVLLQFFFL